jgi:hypothetical protein
LQRKPHFSHDGRGLRAAAAGRLLAPGFAGELRPQSGAAPQAIHSAGPGARA